MSVYGSNLFSKYINFDSTTFGDNFYSTNKSRYPNRSFGMSISYRIGELKASVKKAVRSINNDDVKGGGEGGQGAGGN